MVYTNFFYKNNRWKRDLNKTILHRKTDKIKSITNKYAPDRTLEISHTSINIEPDIHTCMIEGISKLTVVYRNSNLIDSVADRSILSLDAVDFIGVEVTGMGISDFYYNGRVINIHWQYPFEGEEVRDITVVWKVMSPVSGLVFCSPMNSTNFQDQSLFVATECGFERAKYWMPCIDNPSAKSTIEMNIVHQADHLCVANGEYVCTEQILTRSNMYMNKTTFRHNFPCSSYQVSFVVGNLKRIVHDGCPIPITYYYTSGKMESEIFKTFEKTPEIIEWMENKLDVRFPWPKYNQIILPYYMGKTDGTTLAIWSSRFIKEKNMILDNDRIVDLMNVNEIAKSYFGNMVGINHYEDVWIRDGWAKYFEALWIKDSYGESEFEYNMFLNGKTYMDECVIYQRPLVYKDYMTSTSLIDSHSNEGAVWRIHMIRQLLGDSVFWEGAKKFIDTNKWGLVDTNSFKSVMESVSGKNLCRFFDEFIYGLGYPRIKCYCQYVPGTDQVQITVDQGHLPGPDYVQALFGFKLDVNVVDEHNQEHSSTLVFDELSRALTVIKLPEGVRPSYIRIDPLMKMLFSIEFNVGYDMLLNASERASDVRNRIWAYEALIQSGFPNIIYQVRNRIRKEQFYGVRVAVGRALSKNNSREATSLLAELVSSETDSKALMSLSKFSRTCSDANLAKALLRRINDSKIGYKALSNSLHGLGAQQFSNKTDFFIKIANQKNEILHPIVREGFFSGLANTHERESLTYLVSCLESNQENRQVVPVLIRSISYLTVSCADSITRSHVIGVISRELNNCDKMINFSAIDALVRMKAIDKYWEIETSKKRYFAENDHPWIDSQLQQILKGSGNINYGIQQLSILPIDKQECSGEDMVGLYRIIQDLKAKVWGLEFKMEQQSAIRTSQRSDNTQRAEEKMYGYFKTDSRVLSTEANALKFPTAMPIIETSGGYDSISDTLNKPKVSTQLFPEKREEKSTIAESTGDSAGILKIPTDINVVPSSSREHVNRYKNATTKIESKSKSPVIKLTSPGNAHQPTKKVYRENW
ncbi:hypothetical protein BB559_003143 [Furculomyces boomerangus]|uniref:Transcription initiation factor TFIID subunit 2 n=1 Tax=Furculomyces boomerangus TaxID=61424 RepID=A0A2T9YNG5_9FUNG|nr:hypothetical protein BB559_003143 [Furculomyces boomerangus]